VKSRFERDKPYFGIQTMRLRIHVFIDMRLSLSTGSERQVPCGKMGVRWVLEIHNILICALYYHSTGDIRIGPMI
jgi:hypothetical protein